MPVPERISGANDHGDVGSRTKAHPAAGIVTLADSNYFPGLMLLHRSVQECWPVPIACFDLGLTDEQRHIARSVSGLEVVPLPEARPVETIKSEFENAEPLAKRHKRVWPLWICPLLIAASPFRRVFWFDCDIVVLRNLEQLFGLLEDGPVFTPENNAPGATRNKPELYDLLPITRPFDPLEPRVNGGVSGWDLDRDRAVVDAYIHPVARACEDRRVRDAISWHDQGALIWAIQRCGMEHRVVDTTKWNLCVRRSPLCTHPIAWNNHFLGEVRAAVSDANILHWNSMKPPWLD
jgi:hypothetical protein